MNPKALRKTPALQSRDFYPLVFFLTLYFLWVFANYRDFGVDWDEYTLFSRGARLYQYLFGAGIPSDLFLQNDTSADGWVLYNYWYPMLLNFFNKSFSFEFFHLENLFFTSLVFVAIYGMLLAYYRKPWKSLLGPLFLLLTPRFIGYAPFDCKDISFCVFYFLALAGLFHFQGKTGLAKTVPLGILFGLAQSLRLVGLSLYVIWILFYGYEWVQGGTARPRSTRGHHLVFLRDFSLVFILSVFFMVLTWPYLQVDVFSHLSQLFRLSANFPMEVVFLFMGRMVSSAALPWYYLPWWIILSTPLFVLFFLGGVFFFVKKPFQNRLLVFTLLSLGVNLVLVLVLRPAVYVAMRHFLYILPILALLGGLSALEFFQNFQGKPFFRLAAGLALVGAALVVSQMIRLHPYEYVYFNELAGGLKGAFGKFEIEERGTSAKEAVEWLRQNEWTDPRKIYKVTSYQDPFQVIYYLPPNVKYEKEMDKADYLITLPYGGHHRFKNPILHSVQRESVPLMDIYRK